MMKRSSTRYAGLARVVTLAVSLAAAVFLGSCSSKSMWNTEYRADRQQRLERGCVFYFDGAGGGTEKSNYAAGVIDGMLAAGYKRAGELMSWETGQGLMADQKASVEFKRDQAKKSAASLRRYMEQYPGRPVALLGFSAGTAEAIFALESLPEDLPVDRVVLLGASISRDYDMTEALKRIKDRLYIVTSTHDHMLSIAMPLSGTADRKFHDPGAGIKGFALPTNASEETKRLYAQKIATIPYAKDFRKDSDEGHHFDNVKKEFIRDHVAPLLMGGAVNASEVVFRMNLRMKCD
jgi:pimeloyl-ACP methyl ester carboxylesterase